ncbi:MAG: ACP S-malonyltransferase [Deltaproteobacteria bacterium]|nr:ACP S-malonyltransferase [Deltaproteobacteria bacterium]MBK8720094.1 ACP S-malonyltransferase [Deltaproteobacteria bacterium]MBP7289104.1 ACP S-malonyltransferase [Nannocystaceae bacterium]
MASVALVFPGQGSQQVGMGRALFEASAAARAIFEAADDALGMSLSTMCFEGPEDALVQTANTQPAILTCSVAALAALRERLSITPTVVLGHSLGEFSALVAAGALSFADAVRLVRLRGQAMQEAVPQGTGAMAAIIGLPVEELDALCAEAAQGEVVSPANENGGGQIVVAGHAAAVDRLVALAKSRKARAVPLKVSAPFHCALMAPAAQRLAQALADVQVAAMGVPVIANVDAQPNADAAAVKDLLVRQVTQRVRWEASVLRACELGVDTAIEVGHGKVLTGLVKRIAPSLTMHCCGSPADIDVLNGAHVGA